MASYIVYKTITTILFPYLLVRLFIVKSYKYLNKFLSLKTMVLTFLKNTVYMHTFPLIKL